MAKVGALCFASFGDPGFFRSRWYFGDIWGGFWDSVQICRFLFEIFQNPSSFHIDGVFDLTLPILNITLPQALYFLHI